MKFAFNIKYLYPFPNEAKKLHFPAQYVEIVIARNLNKHKLVKHERNNDRCYETYRSKTIVSYVINVMKMLNRQET